MSYIPFEKLPSAARLWVFPLDRKLSDAEAMQFQAEIAAFLAHWTAHNESLLAGCDLRYGQFLMVATDEAAAKASGCSIDELYRRVRMLGETFGINYLGNLNVQFREPSGTIVSTSRETFGQMAASGAISGKTTVFDNSITSVEALRAGKWELPAGASWHAKAFELA